MIAVSYIRRRARRGQRRRASAQGRNVDLSRPWKGALGSDAVTWTRVAVTSDEYLLTDSPRGMPGMLEVLRVISCTAVRRKREPCVVMERG